MDKSSFSIHGQKRGLSDLMATILLVAMTLIAGAALFGYVNGQASGSENKIGAANAVNVNFLNERFVVVNVALSPGSTSASIWVYNNGNLSLTLKQIAVYQTSNQGQTFYVIFDNTPSSGSCGSASSPSHGSAAPFTFGSGGTQIPQGSDPQQITLTLPGGCTGGFAASTNYSIIVLGVYGNVVVASDCDSTSPAGQCTK